MVTLERILVCMKRPDRDDWLAASAAAVARAAGSREIHLLHVRPPSPAARPADLAPPPANPASGEPLEALASRHFQGHPREGVICRTAAGAVMVEILRYAMDKDIDLILLGRRAGKTGTEVALPRRVAMKATCSVLVVPEEAPLVARRILVPVRNSDCSARALEAACALAAATGGQVCCLNVFPIRGDYLEADLTLEEHTALMRQWAEGEIQQLLASLHTSGVPVTTQCLSDVNGRPTRVILESVAGQSADCVVIGARGRTGAAGVLLGAVTEQLICQSPVPVLAVKKKGECLGILRALLTLAGE